ncbi:bis(5'-nucleosyl)-tetraphosphatase (symmetrical) YqeK [Paraclostridium sordellii]|uniref:bis(5'-nucleosyl)-tetraphosphatase (symmetrical) n=1 Tax=Paraclostridium sordellii TaxID=1505 RepID=A0A0C7R098_PARSO|nr:bis(5'-nucleosyl)-tetraphosphatase (symmetrical) YqeK [Paeniclostridium sordellii]CEN77586.1 HD superfamily hydrolase [[Clostridium] sordellii] [Paeniclostridium sordellii]CEQ02673.1 HD superfamily hydrolase [[Clostridium] sordellii] [Paeniclostridium sordellii]
MNINNYEYVKITEITGDIIVDIKNFLLENDKSKTLKHVIDVANTNSKIAKKYGLDENICIISAYLHDISTVIQPNDMLNYMYENNLFIDEAERKHSFLLHQRISRLIVKDFLGIDDELILSAIECHTTLKQNPSKYDMALFIADKISWDQEGVPPFYDIVIENLSISLEKACLSYINYIIDNNMILYPHSWIIEGKEYLNKELNIRQSK